MTATTTTRRLAAILADVVGSSRLMGVDEEGTHDRFKAHLVGDTERAAFELSEARKLSGDDRYSSIARLQASGFFAVDSIRTLYEATYFAGLRKAGMPEE